MQCKYSPLRVAKQQEPRVAILELQYLPVGTNDVPMIGHCCSNHLTNGHTSSMHRVHTSFMSIWPSIIRILSSFITRCKRKEHKIPVILYEDTCDTVPVQH
jgi:hypothetical protein